VKAPEFWIWLNFSHITVRNCIDRNASGSLGLPGSIPRKGKSATFAFAGYWAIGAGLEPK
jgi:hypothetical protein